MWGGGAIKKLTSGITKPPHNLCTALFTNVNALCSYKLEDNDERSRDKLSVGVCKMCIGWRAITLISMCLRVVGVLCWARCTQYNNLITVIVINYPHQSIPDKTMKSPYPHSNVVRCRYLHVGYTLHVGCQFLHAVLLEANLNPIPSTVNQLFRLNHKQTFTKSLRCLFLSNRVFQLLAGDRR